MEWRRKAAEVGPSTLGSAFASASDFGVPVRPAESAASFLSAAAAAAAAAAASSSRRFFLKRVSVIGRKNVQSKPYCLQC